MIDDALEFPRDDAGRVVGFLIGKAAKLADWRHRKELIETRVLIARLRSAKWLRATKIDPRLRELRKATERRFYKRHKVRLDEAQRQRRAKLYRERAMVYTCVECGAQWCKAPWVRFHSRDFCSRRCKRRNYDAARRTRG